MRNELLQRLLSFENEFNKRYGATYPLYKFHRLYEDRNELSDDEQRSLLHVEKPSGGGYHVLNPFLVSLLRTHSIWFAPSTQFNDPWDAGGAIEIIEANVAIKESILKVVFGDNEYLEVSQLTEKERRKRIEDVLRDTFSVLRFACFTKRCYSNPMWAHYGDNHRGVCLQFQFMRPIPNDPYGTYAIDPAFTGHYEVRYSNNFAQVPDINDIGSAIQILHTKHPDWSYEEEVRFLKLGDTNHTGVGGTVSFHKTSLTAVILGCKVPPVLWRSVERILDYYGYTRTKLFRATFDYRTQELKFLEKQKRQSADPASGTV